MISFGYKCNEKSYNINITYLKIGVIIRNVDKLFFYCIEKPQINILHFNFKINSYK